MAAAGHFGNKSYSLVKNIANNLGLEYLSAANKEGFLFVYEKFIDSDISDRPMIFEVFTNTEDESNAYDAIQKVMVKPETLIISKLKKVIKSVVGQNGIDAIKKVFR